jgi:hypothetical protein
MIGEVLFSFENPLPEGAVISFHNNYVSVIDNTVIVHFGDSVVKSEIFQASNLGENIM